MIRSQSGRKIAARFAKFAAAVVPILLSVGCGSASEEDSAVTARIPPAEVDAGIIEILRDGEKDLQLALVEDDKELSWPEYNQLFYTLQQCVNDRGGEVRELQLLAGGTYFFSVHTPPGSTATSCLSEFWQPLGALWSFSHQPPVDLFLAANRTLADCLREGGVDIRLQDEQQPRAEDFQRLGGPADWFQEPFVSCTALVAETYSLPPGFRGY